MRVGILVELRNPPPWRAPWAEHYARWLSRIEEADRAGLGAVWLSEHHLFEDGYLPQPLTFAAAVAARTSRVRIGTAIMLGALRPPLQIAEEAAIVDLVSNGRLELGLGSGYRRVEFEAYGVDLRKRFALTLEHLSEVSRLFASGELTPPTIQQPVPLWGGFHGPRGARHSGRLGISLLDVSHEAHVEYMAGLEEGGHDPASARMGGPLQFVLADDPEAAWPRIAPHLAYMWGTYIEYGNDGATRPLDWESWVGPGTRGVDIHFEVAGGRPGGYPIQFTVLTPEEAETFVRERCAGLPVSDIMCWGAIAGMPDDLVDRHVELLATDLGPRLAAL